MNLEEVVTGNKVSLLLYQKTFSPLFKTQESICHQWEIASFFASLLVVSAVLITSLISILKGLVKLD